MSLKYELLEDDVIMSPENKPLYRIRALIDFGNVKKGDLGGYVESDSNLWRGTDDNSWVGDEAQAFGGSFVCHNAQLRGHSKICGKAQLRNNAQAHGYTLIRDNAFIYGDVIICGYPILPHDIKFVCDLSRVNDDIIVNSSDPSMNVISPGVIIGGNANIGNNAHIDNKNDDSISKKVIILGNTRIYADAYISRCEDYNMAQYTIKGDKVANITAYKTADGSLRFVDGDFIGTKQELMDMIESRSKAIDLVNAHIANK